MDAPPNTLHCLTPIKQSFIITLFLATIYSLQNHQSPQLQNPLQLILLWTHKEQFSDSQ